MHSDRRERDQIQCDWHRLERLPVLTRYGYRTGGIAAGLEGDMRRPNVRAVMLVYNIGRNESRDLSLQLL